MTKIMNYFEDCQTEEQCKKAYRQLFALHHTDCLVMSIINKQLKEALTALQTFAAIAAQQTNAAAPPIITATQPTEDKTQTIINAASYARSIEGITNVEVNGLWVWVTSSKENAEGNRKLKAYGFSYTAKKQQWYFHTTPHFRTKHALTMEQIRLKYGSNNSEPQKIKF